jgi:hypothetical protein
MRRPLIPRDQRLWAWLPRMLYFDPPQMDAEGGDRLFEEALPKSSSL